jgi:AcrR family transcriptional regulator
MKTKDRILFVALDLFNADGATEVTTNDIAKALKMSPGNLYFHYKNKEQIIREIFKRMMIDTATIWRPQTKIAKNKEKFPLIDFIDKNLQLYWKYRFFHREMYILRKKDPDLSKLWHRHVKKTSLLMVILYKHWVKSGFMNKITSKYEMEFVVELLFVASNSFMQFIETTDRGESPPRLKTFEKARRHIIRMLMPYLSEDSKKDYDMYFQMTV